MLVVPTETSVAPVSNVPVTVAVVPPAATPALGETPLTVGIGAYAYWSEGCAVLVPSAVVTMMSTVPATCAGMYPIVSCVALFTVKHGALGVGGQGIRRCYGCRRERSSW